jgi:hypothetical protein
MAWVGPAISAGGSLLSSVLGGKGAKKAAAAQAAAYQKGIDEQSREFDASQARFKPYSDYGLASMGQLSDFLGLNGADKQGVAYDSLKSSPAFTSRYNTGVDTILQNSSATGGLRGGNTQNSLANFGSNLFGDVLNTQIGNLTNGVGIGSGTVTTLGNLGQQNANSIADLLGRQGGAQASGILGQSNAYGNGITDISKILSQVKW